MKVLVVRVLANAAALWVATVLVDGITAGGASTAEKVLTLIAVAAIFGLVNAVVRPIVKLLTLPLFVLTLGLITVLVNALMLWLTSWASQQLELPFEVAGFWSAVLGALVVSVVSFLLNVILPDKYEGR